MGGALLLALPAFQWALRHVRSGGHPLANVCYELPSKTAVDGNLVWGALLFGAGWGECEPACGDAGYSDPSAWPQLHQDVLQPSTG